MRPLYLLLKILIFYAVNLFFKRYKRINAPKKINAQTIFVVNHASAFLDPWIIAELQRPVLFFLARGDVFKPWLKPVTWAAHMIPIYRTKENGADSAEKNEAIFKEVYGLLKNRKSILIFGEGYTDDVFIRSLKSLKKGPARIGFGAMEASNWQSNIKIQAAGINYADPNKFRSEVLVANSEPIYLKDYKASYLENPSKAILDLTTEITERLKAQLTFLEDHELTDLHNHIQSITKKGIQHGQSDESIDLETRWRYSQALATKINAQYDDSDQNWTVLKDNLETYFSGLETNDINDQWILDYQNSKSKNLLLRSIALIIAFPVFLIGCFHHLIPYQFVKRFTENTFKRKVFWSGIKMLLGYLVLALFNIALCFIVNGIFNIMNTALLWLYIIAIVPITGLIAYWYATYFSGTIALAKISDSTLKKWLARRQKCESLINETIK